MESNTLCSFCNKKNIYAKNLCRNCYERNRVNGKTEYKPVSVYIPKIGDTSGKLTVSKILENRKVKCLCECGNHKTLNFESFKNKKYDSSCDECKRLKRIKNKGTNPKTDRQKQIVELHKSGMTYIDIGKNLGITKQAVGQAMKSASSN